jgi:hypothetical protein
MDHAHAFYKSRTRVLLLAMDLAFLLPYTVRTLGIISCGVLQSYMRYTKQILSCPFPYYYLVEMLDSLDPPSTPLWLDMSYDTGFIPVVVLPAKPLLEFGIFFV